MRRGGSILVLLLTLGGIAHAQTSAGQVEQLKQLSIEELADTDITTASRRIERLADVPAAVSVITGEDLRRLGVMTVGQALRLAGHLDVVRTSGPQYAISARGFTISTANKLLVLIDGRTVYSPVFAGVFWDTQDAFLPDVERIEVTRGPGGSLWGANAVNGVINIITKRAADTRGTIVNAAAGSSTLGPYAVRHGGRIGNNGSYRAYAKVRVEGSHRLETGADAEDEFAFGQAGFRLELDRPDTTDVFLQGDLYSGTTGRLAGSETTMSGGNLLGRFSRTYGVHSSQLQAYFDHTYRRMPGQYRGVLNTIDLDMQHQWRARRHNVVLGAGYRRYAGDDLGEGPGFFFEPRHRTSHRLNFFVQDEVRLFNTVFFTAGSKFERNEFTGFEVQPTVRARWSTRRHSLWGAVSRAVRVPSRLDTDLRIVAPGSTTVSLSGSPAFRAESVLAYEGGYRQQFHDRLSVDLAAYVNRYDDLRSQELGRPITLGNMGNAQSRGLESSATVQPTDFWQLHAAHSFHWKTFTFDPASTDATSGASEFNDPRHILTVRSHLIATTRLELDALFRHHASRPQPFVARYSELDARVGYRVRPGWDVSLIGSHLLHDRHLEFRTGTAAELFERSVTLRSVWRF